MEGIVRQKANEGLQRVRLSVVLRKVCMMSDALREESVRSAGVSWALASGSRSRSAMARSHSGARLLWVGDVG